MANPVSGSVWGLDAATLAVSGTNFKAYNIAIRNDFNYIADASKYPGTQGAQGLALSIGGDRAVLYNCHLFGNQDTLYLKSGRAYFYESQIDGNIDFIFGNEDGIAYFEKCTIKAISRNGGEQEGYVTAMKGERGAGKKYAEYGYIFDDCTFTDDGKCATGSMSLGRTWGKNPSVAIINSKLSKVYSKAAYGSGAKTTRYSSMNGTPVDAFFVECNNTALAEGNDGSISANVDGCKVINDATAYNKTNIFAASNGSITWASAWDCDTELSNLKIIAGLEEGEIPEDPIKTINFAVANPGVAPDVKFEGMLEWTDYYRWNGNSIQVDSRTEIKVLIPGKVTIKWYEDKYGSDAARLITYDNEGKATIKIIQDSSIYIECIYINTGDVPQATQTIEITVDYNDDGVTTEGKLVAIVGAPLSKPKDPTREGYKFTGWKVNGVDYDFTENVTETFTLVAQWGAQDPDYDITTDVIDLSTFTTGTVQGGTATYRGVIFDATASGAMFATFAGDGGYAQMKTGAVLKFAAPDNVTSADGVTITMTFHKGQTVASGVNIEDLYEVGYEDGYITVTAKHGDGTYPYNYPLTITFNFPEGGEEA